MNKVEVMNLTTVCRNFPENLEPEIYRENLLESIERIFETGTHLIGVEGTQGVGFTTLLSQFAKRHPHNTLSLFIKPGSSLAYSPEFIRIALCEQLHWALYKKELPDLLDAPLYETFLKTNLLNLQKIALKSREIYYFIVDGLLEIPREGHQLRETILKDMLPIGLSGFRFLISGELQQLSEYIHEKTITKHFPLPAFSLDESTKYFRDLNLDRHDLEDIHKTCKGIPKNLASVRRLLISGAELQGIFGGEASKLPDFLGIEWRKVVSCTVEQKKILAVIAFGCKEYTLEELSLILEISQPTIEQFLYTLGIISIDPQKKVTSFISESHRKYALQQLNDYKEEATNLSIKYLLKDVNSDQAVNYLPTYFEQANRLQDLLDYLTPDYFSKLLEKSQSVNLVMRRLELGLIAAKTLNHNDALIRFSLQKAILNELNGVKILRSEIEARMSLGDYASALSLAHTAFLKEDRLHLLSIIAKIRHEKGLSKETEIMEQISILYQQIDIPSLGERAIEIASDLIYSDPDLAIAMVESSTQTNNEKDDLDFAFAKLSIAAQDANKDKLQSTDIANKTLSKIKNPTIQSFSVAVSVLFCDYSAKEVISQVNKLEIAHRLFCLRQWALANQNREDAAEVIEFSLDLLIKNTPYTPKTRDLREIATPLPKIKDTSKAKQLVGRIDSQKGIIEALGATEDFVRLQLLLAEAESKYDVEASYNRTIEIYWYINALTDLAIKTECMAWLVAALPDIDHQGILESREGTQEVTQNELQQFIKQLLLSTAEHFFVARGAIRALAKAKPETAFDLAQSLNTERRRNKALLELIEALLEHPITTTITHIIKCLDHITYFDIKDEATINLLRKLSKVPEKLPQAVLTSTLGIINNLQIHLANLEERCKGYCFAYIFLSKQDPIIYASLSEHLLSELKDSWMAIDAGWLRVNTGFRVVRLLAEHSLSIASNYLKLVDTYREKIIFDSKTPTKAYIACLQLGIRAYGGLLPKNLNTDGDLETLLSLISKIPSYGTRAQLLGELALRCYTNGKPGLCKDIVVKHLRPLLDNINPKDNYYKIAVLGAIAPALYQVNKITTLELITSLPSIVRDEIYEEICNFLLHKLPSSDPCDIPHGTGCSITHDEATELCDVVKLMSRDGFIHNNIEVIADSIMSPRNKDYFSRQQKIDVASRLENIANTKLPDNQNIQHDGYKIAALTQIARIKQSNKQEAENLIQATTNIPNIADQALVVCIIATVLFAKDVNKRNQVIGDALKIIDRIPVDLDKMDRYILFADMMGGVDPSISKKCLKLAMEVTSNTNASDSEIIHQKQRRIIDIAYRLEPSYAATLADLLDNDPARKNSHSNIRKRLQFLDTKKKIAENNSEINTTSKPLREHYPTAAWNNLGALNANRISPLHFDFLKPHIQVASEFPLRKSYFIFSWIIENIIKRVSKADQARAYLVPVFKAAIQGAELVEKIAIRSLTNLQQIKTNIITVPENSLSVVIKPGEREKALQFIKDWFSKEVNEYLKIADPYFGIDDLDLIFLLSSICPSCKVHILTSKKHQSQILSPIDEAYQLSWNKISDQSPPETDITVFGTASKGEPPIHDRWWITKGSGLRIGTSFNSLGVSKLSEICILSPDEFVKREREIDSFLRREIREHKNERLLYNVFSL